jgi:hypothetical protein
MDPMAPIAAIATATVSSISYVAVITMLKQMRVVPPSEVTAQFNPSPQGTPGPARRYDLCVTAATSANVK